MMPLTQHPLLAQLLRRVGANEAEPPTLDAWRDLLKLVSQMYYESDHDRDTLERSIENSSRDMQQLYQDLKHRTESERVEQEAIMRATLESAIEGIMIVDNKRQVIAMNKRFAEMAQLPESELAQRDQRVLAALAVKSVKTAESVLSRIDGMQATDGTQRVLYFAIP